MIVLVAGQDNLPLLTFITKFWAVRHEKIKYICPLSRKLYANKKEYNLYLLHNKDILCEHIIHQGRIIKLSICHLRRNIQYMEVGGIYSIPTFIIKMNLIFNCNYKLYFINNWITLIRNNTFVFNLYYVHGYCI